MLLAVCGIVFEPPFGLTLAVTSTFNLDGGLLALFASGALVWCHSAWAARWACIQLGVYVALSFAVPLGWLANYNFTLVSIGGFAANWSREAQTALLLLILAAYAALLIWEIRTAACLLACLRQPDRPPEDQPGPDPQPSPE